MIGLKNIRKARNLNQQKVAMDLNISREALSYYENGKREPSLTLLVAMSRYFNVSINYLITGEEKMPNSAAVLLPRLPYRVLLRDSYHAAVCNGFNYARAADETVDPCLKKILQRFSEANYAAAEEILHILTQVR